MLDWTEFVLVYLVVLLDTEIILMMIMMMVNKCPKQLANIHLDWDVTTTKDISDLFASYILNEIPLIKAEIFYCKAEVTSQSLTHLPWHMQQQTKHRLIQQQLTLTPLNSLVGEGNKKLCCSVCV